jgi:hypothetical protein
MYKEDCPNCIGDGYFDLWCPYCDGGGAKPTSRPPEQKPKATVTPIKRESQ